MCVCALLFLHLFFLSLGHMLLTRFLAQEKRKEYRAMKMGNRRTRKVLDKEGKVVNHMLHTGATVKNHKENER